MDLERSIRLAVDSGKVSLGSQKSLEHARRGDDDQWDHDQPLAAPCRFEHVLRGVLLAGDHRVRLLTKRVTTVRWFITSERRYWKRGSHSVRLSRTDPRSIDRASESMSATVLSNW